VVEGSVSLSFSNAPAGASVLLRATSEPAGVALVAGGDCTVDADYPGFLVCTPEGGTSSPEVATSSSSLFTRMITSAVGTGEGEPLTVSAPLEVQPDAADNTALTVEYLLTDEQSGGIEAGTAERVLRIANVGLSSPMVTAPSDAAGPFKVTGMLDGLPTDGVAAVTYTLDGPARFVEQADPDCVSEDGTRLTCSSPVEGPVDFLVVPNDRAAGATISIAALPIAGFIDPQAGNNAIELTLPATPPTPPPLTVNAELLDPTPGQPERSVRVKIGGAPAGPVTFELVGTDGAAPSPVDFRDADSCTLAEDAQLVTCTIGEDGIGSWTFLVDLPQGHVDETFLRVTFAGLPTKDVPLTVPAPGGGSGNGTGPAETGVSSDPKGKDPKGNGKSDLSQITDLPAVDLPGPDL
jgi:hypothetical protein